MMVQTLSNKLFICSSESLTDSTIRNLLACITFSEKCASDIQQLVWQLMYFVFGNLLNNENIRGE